MIKKKIVISVLIFTFFLGFFFFYLRNPEQNIIREDEGTSYLELYYRCMSTDRFDSLLEKVIKNNEDIHSLNVIALFALDKSKCKVLPLLKDRCEVLQELPLGSIWTVKLTSNHYRDSSREMLDFSNSFCYTIHRLESKCSQ